MSELSEKIIRNIHLGIENDLITDDDLVQIIEHAGKFLNLETISNYSARTGISYNGVKKFRRNIKIFNVNFVMDNI
mgnify:FL=1